MISSFLPLLVTSVAAAVAIGGPQAQGSEVLKAGASAVGVDEGTLLKAAERAAGTGYATLLQDANLGRSVSVTFNTAKFSDVLMWLRKEGVSFVTEDHETDEGPRLTMNIVNKPLRDVMDAIAEVFGGTWTKKGDVYAFVRRRAGFPFGAFEFGDLGKSGELWIAPGMSPEEQEKFRKEFEPMMKEWAKKFQEEFEKNWIGPDGKWLLPKGEEIERLKEELPEVSEKMFREFRIEIPELKLELEKELQELKKLDPEKFRSVLPEGRGFVFGGPQLAEILKSLTQEQRKLHDERGYLTPNDLTAAQKKMLGGLPETGDWTVTIAVDGKKLTIKSK